MEYVALVLCVLPLILLVLAMCAQSDVDRHIALILTKVSFVLCYGTMTWILFKHFKFAGGA